MRGLLNVQYALAADVLYVLEANPRASRTVPFVSKATAVPLAKAAARDHARRLHRRSCATRGCCPRPATAATLPPDAPVAVKEAVLPFGRFRPAGRVDTVLGPEMRSTGEVMGIDAVFGTAFAKSQAAAYRRAARRRAACSSRVANRDKRAMVFPVKRLADLGFEVLATAGHRRGAAPQRGRATVVRKH